MWPAATQSQVPGPPYADCGGSLTITAWIKLTIDVPNLRLVELGPDVKETVIQNHNNIPPLSDDHPAKVWFLTSEGDPYFILAFTDEDNCLTAAWPIRLIFMEFLLAPLMGPTNGNSQQRFNPYHREA